LYGRRLTGAGVVSMTETINIADSGVTEDKPDLVYLNAQIGYVVVWGVSSGASRGVYSRIVARDGGTTAPTYQLGNSVQPDKLPRIDLDAQGRALVIWHHRLDLNTDHLYGRRLTSSGQALGNQFTILAMANTRHAYPALASNGAGRHLLVWQDNRSGNWDIYGQPFQHLSADFTAGPISGSPPLTTIFTDTSTPGNAADLFHWDFGDGHITTAQQPTHTYTETGLFTVTLTITDTDTGETDTKVRVGYITTLPAEWHELNTGQAPLVAG